MQIKLSPFDDFDQALSVNRQPNTEFVLQKGLTYSTRGNWYYKDYKHLAPRCKLHGEGARLILSKDAIRSVAGVVRPDRDVNVLWVDDDSTVTNLTLDGNQATFVDPDPQKTWFVQTGLRGFGKQYLSNVTVESIRGSYSPVGTLSNQIESFAFSTKGVTGGDVIKNCVIQNCPENSYITSFNIGHVGPNVAQSLVSNCRIDIGKDNWVAFGVNCRVLIKNCVVNGNKISVYNDTDITDNVVIDGCEFNDVEKLLSFVIPQGKSEPKTNIQVKNSKVGFTAGAARHLVELWDKNADNVKRALGHVLIQDCKITQDIATVLYVATVGNDIRPITIVNTPLLNLNNMANSQLSIF